MENTPAPVIPAYVSLGMNSAANLLQKVDAASVSEARQSAGNILKTMMAEDGAISLDPDLALRAYQILSTSEVQILEAQRKLIETYASLSEKALLLSKPKEDTPLNPEVSQVTPDPLASAQNSAFQQIM